MINNNEKIEKLKEYKKKLIKRNRKDKIKTRVIKFLPHLPGITLFGTFLIWNITTDSCYSPFNMNSMHNSTTISHIDEDKKVKKEETDKMYSDCNVSNTITAYSDYFKLPDGTYMRTAKVYDLSNFDKDKAIELLDGDTQNKIEELLGLPINTYSEQKEKLDEQDNAKKHYLIKYYEKGKPIKKTVANEIGAIELFALVSLLGYVVSAFANIMIKDRLPNPPKYYSEEELEKLLEWAKDELKILEPDKLIEKHFPARTPSKRKKINIYERLDD